MACRKTDGPLRQTQWAVSTTGVVFPWGRWWLLPGMKTFRMAHEVRDKQGNYGQKPKFRTATERPDRPNAWSDFTGGGQLTTNDIVVIDEDVSTITDKMWIQGGLEVSLTTGSTPGYATVTVRTQSDGCGKLVGATTLEVTPSTNSTETAYLPLPNLFPLVGISKVAASFVISSVTGTLDYALAMRSYENDRVVAGDWVALETLTQSQADRYTGELAVTGLTPAVTAAMWGQLGVAVKGTDAQARIMVAYAAKYS